MWRKISRNVVPSSCIRHDNSTKENFIFNFYTIFLIYTYSMTLKALVNLVENNKNFTVDQKWV
jgi:hypothetical protein